MIILYKQDSYANMTTLTEKLRAIKPYLEEDYPSGLIAEKLGVGQ